MSLADTFLHLFVSSLNFDHILHLNEPCVYIYFTLVPSCLSEIIEQLYLVYTMYIYYNKVINYVNYTIVHS